ncbi:MAG: hypothetical protein HYR90_00225 [Candidatus Andersenbacteria bacterium]|nr:hypothetical protein [Candidatus Andersenbacteria bacterium]MBI3250665.1 hypothetical protein [Candidatus Andersenbacteria bacterium]
MTEFFRSETGVASILLIIFSAIALTIIIKKFAPAVTFGWIKKVPTSPVFWAIIFILFLTPWGWSLTRQIASLPVRTHGDPTMVAYITGEDTSEQETGNEEITSPFTFEMARLVYSREPFQNGATPNSSQSFPTYEITTEGQNPTVFSGIDCTLCQGGTIVTSCPQSGEGFRKRLHLGSESDWISLPRTEHEWSIDGDDELLYLRGTGSVGNRFTPNLQIRLPGKAIVTRSIWQISGGESVKWGKIPLLPSGWQWTLSLRFVRPDAVSFPPEVWSADRAAFILWAADESHILHEEKLAQEETKRTNQIVKEDAVLEIFAPHLPELVEVRATLRIEPL